MLLLRAKYGGALLAIIVLVIAVQPCNAKVTEAEKAALLEWKGMQTEAAAKVWMGNWSPDSDPCEDAWMGLVCDCHAASFSGNVSDDCEVERKNEAIYGIWIVRALNDGNGVPPLTGPLPASFSALTDLRSLGLSGQRINNIDVLWDMPDLEGIALTGNLLEAELSELRWTDLPRLKFLLMQHNWLAGPVPDSWCSHRLMPTVLDIRNNSYLCGLDDSCFTSVQDSMIYQYGMIIMYADNQDPMYCCGVVKPNCDAPGVCRVIVPEYWTNESDVTFLYSGVNNPNNERLSYKTYVYSVLGSDVCQVALDNNNRSFVYVNETWVSANNIANITYRVSPGVLKSGALYQVGVMAMIVGCESRTKWASNDSFVKTSFREPNPPTVFNTDSWEMRNPQYQTDYIGVSWTSAFDPDGVPCCTYALQVWKATMDNVSHGAPLLNHQQLFTQNITPVIHTPYAESRRMTIPVQLQTGSSYYVTVTATNDASQAVTAFTYVEIQESPGSSGPGPGIITLSTVLSVAAAALILGLSYVVYRGSRQRARAKEEKRAKQELAKFRNFLRTVTMAAHSENAFNDPSHLAFVITDLENSTACAAADKHAYKDVQVVHDRVMREHIAAFGGLEVVTEGDSFQVAFATVGAAVQWCMEVQRVLLETDWNRKVLRLPSCSIQHNHEGRLCFNGPRVRMGLHWATSDSFKIQQIEQTERKMFRGVGWDLAKEVGDIGYGGQVLMTEPAWAACQVSMATAGFPLVKQLGLFKLENWRDPMWLYEVCELLGRPLGRLFPPLQKLQPLFVSDRANLIPPPAATLARLKVQSRCYDEGVNGKDVDVEDLKGPGTGSGTLDQDSAEAISSTGSGQDDATVATHPATTPATSLPTSLASRKGIQCISLRPQDATKAAPNPAKAEAQAVQSAADAAQRPQMSVGSFVSGAGGDSIKLRLEELRERAHTGRWNDAFLQPQPDEMAFVACRLVTWPEQTASDEEWNPTRNPWALPPTPLESDKALSFARRENSFTTSARFRSFGKGTKDAAGTQDAVGTKRERPPLPRSDRSKKLLAGQVPEAAVELMQRVFAIAAQEWKGYIFRTPDPDSTELAFAVVFDDTLDAVCFCHSVQHLLMFQKWPVACKDIFGPCVESADAMHVYNGPRMAMALHYSKDYSCMTVGTATNWAGRMYWPPDVQYWGGGLTIAKELVYAVHGGQVVVSERAWRCLQERLPGQIEVLDCGSYALPGCGIMSLKQLLPQSLSVRQFPDLRGGNLLRKGFIHSPDPDKPLAVCFVKVNQPAAIKDALKEDVACATETIVDLLTAFYSGVTLAEQVVRQTLDVFDGYECKNPEPGKFTLAFSVLEDAIRFGCAVQLQLLDVPWPDTLLKLEECRPVYGASAAHLLFRGLKMRMGITWDRAATRKPLNTGCADYFGDVANMAARIMGTARPGQVLVHGTPDLIALGQPWPTSQPLSPGKIPTRWTSMGLMPGLSPSSGSGMHMSGNAPYTQPPSNAIPEGDDVAAGEGFVGGSGVPEDQMEVPVQRPGHAPQWPSCWQEHMSFGSRRQSEYVPPHSGDVWSGESAALPANGHSVSFDQLTRYLGPSPYAEETIVLRPAGKFKLKGFKEEQVLFLATTVALADRTFPDEVVGKPASISDLPMRFNSSDSNFVQKMKDFFRQLGPGHNGASPGSFVGPSGTNSTTSRSAHRFSASCTRAAAPSREDLCVPRDSPGGSASAIPGRPGGSQHGAQPSLSSADLAHRLCRRGTQRYEYIPLTDAQLDAARELAQQYAQRAAGSTSQATQANQANQANQADQVHQPNQANQASQAIQANQASQGNQASEANQASQANQAN